MLLASCTHFLVYMVMNCTQRSWVSPTPFSDHHTVTADNNTWSIMHPVVFAAALNREFQLNWHPSRRDGSRCTAAGRTDGGVTAGVVGGFKVELTDHNLLPCLTKQRLRKDTPSGANKAMYRMHTKTVNSTQHHLISSVAVEVADWRWYNFLCHNPPQPPHWGSCLLNAVTWAGNSHMLRNSCTLVWEYHHLGGVLQRLDANAGGDGVCVCEANVKTWNWD